MKPFVFKMITESGNAIKSSTPLPVEFFDETIKNIKNILQSKLKLSPGDYQLLGSTGKKTQGTYGDIDIGVRQSVLMKKMNIQTEQEFYSKIESLLKTISHETYSNRGSMIISFAAPFKGTSEKKYVQVDLMFSDNFEWQSFFYSSPSQKQSAYKGVHRNIMMFSIISVLYTKELGNNTQSKHTISALKGMQKKVVSLLSAKGQKLKNPKVIDNEVLTDNPIEVVKMLLGDKGTIKDTESFESLYRFVTSNKFPYSNDIKTKIFKTFAERIVEQGFFVPKELAGKV